MTGNLSFSARPLKVARISGCGGRSARLPLLEENLVTYDRVPVQRGLLVLMALRMKSFLNNRSRR
jgi:hypothetical protein